MKKEKEVEITEPWDADRFAKELTKLFALHTPCPDPEIHAEFLMLCSNWRSCFMGGFLEVEAEILHHYIIAMIQATKAKYGN